MENQMLNFIQDKVLEIYKALDCISYPLNPEEVLSCLHEKCHFLTYQKLSELTKSPIAEIQNLFGSEAGAAQYRPAEKRYLILYNAEMSANDVLWTQIHEIAHIHFHHFDTIGRNIMALHGQESRFNDLEKEIYRRCEYEADLYTLKLLAPIPVMEAMGIQSPEEIQAVFGLPRDVAQVRYSHLQKREYVSVETSWDQLLLQEFDKKYAL